MGREKRAVGIINNYSRFLAESVVMMLQKLALSGRTVITTIHQPSSEVFILFDRFVLLADGMLAFMGSHGNIRLQFNLNVYK